MPEEGQTAPEGQAAPEVVSTVTPTQAVTETTPSFLNAEGGFAEGWTQQLPEDIRNEQCLSTWKDIPSMAKSFVNAQRMVGKDKIGIPTESSTEDEWSNFHSAGGRPDEAAGYALTRPQDFPEELYDDGLAGKAQELFHKIGLSKKQADALFEFNNTNILGASKDFEQGQENATQATIDKLQQDWGQDFERRIWL